MYHTKKKNSYAPCRQDTFRNRNLYYCCKIAYFFVLMAK